MARTNRSTSDPADEIAGDIANAFATLGELGG